MKKIKQLALFVLSSVLVFNMEDVQAKEEYGLNIFNEGGSPLSGYTLQLQVCNASESLSNPLYTQTIDVSQIPPSQPRFFPLEGGFGKQLANYSVGKSKTCVSLLDNKGQEIAKADNLLDFEHLRHSPVLQVKLNASKKTASINSNSDLLGLALIEAPQD